MQTFFSPLSVINRNSPAGQSGPSLARSARAHPIGFSIDRSPHLAAAAREWIPEHLTSENLAIQSVLLLLVPVVTIIAIPDPISLRLSSGVDDAPGRIESPCLILFVLVMSASPRPGSPGKSIKGGVLADLDLIFSSFFLFTFPDFSETFQRTCTPHTCLLTPRVTTHKTTSHLPSHPPTTHIYTHLLIYRHTSVYHQSLPLPHSALFPKDVVKNVCPLRYPVLCQRHHAAAGSCR